MKLLCENCSKELNIPDSKIPAGKAFSIKCPSCGNKISAKLESTAPEEEAPQESQKPARPELNLDIKKVEAMEDYLEQYETDEPCALVCDAENAETIEKELKEMGYRMSAARDVTVAVNKIKFNQYKMIIINERFDGYSLKDNPVLLNVQPMRMSERRYIFIVLIGESVRTQDAMTAFTLSVDLTVNSKDIQNLSSLLTQGIQENDRFYKIYKEALAAEGKV